MLRGWVPGCAMALIICGGTALDICGNFCGPTWCDGAATAECADVKGAACVKSAGDCSESKATDGSCADACCRKHDTCCGSTDRRPCNTEIVSCLEQCGGMSGDDDLPSCYLGWLPVPVVAIETAMALLPFECCGTSCDYSGRLGVDGRALVAQE